MNSLRRLAAPLVGVMLTSTALLSAEAQNDHLTTKTKIRVERNGIWLESEVAPQALLAVLPELDLQPDAILDERELSEGRDQILKYYGRHVALEIQGKQLQADSTYFAFRAPAAKSAAPDKFYVYHWYATLKPAYNIRITNELFSELDADFLNQGWIIKGEQVTGFDFPKPVAGQNSGLEFAITNDGAILSTENNDPLLQAGYMWVAVGLSGLVLLRLLTRVRKRFGRKHRKEEPEEEDLFSANNGDWVLRNGSAAVSHNGRHTALTS